MLQTNTMRYGTDRFSFNKSGLIRPNQPLDCTNFTIVNSIDFIAAQPTDTDIRLVFLVDGSYGKLVVDGTISAVATQAITTDSVLEEGNTIAELQALSSIPAFVGKEITPAIALYAPLEAKTIEEMPMIKFKGIKGVNIADVLSKQVVSPICNLSTEMVEIVGLSAETSATNATAIVTVSLEQNGVWGEFISLANAKNQKATAVKFQADVAVTTVNTGTASIGRVSCTYKSNNAVVTGDFADIVTITQEFEGLDMRFGRLMIKHQALNDANIKAYISMRTEPKKREMIPIGVGIGTTQHLTLKPLAQETADQNVNHNTIKIYYGATPVYDFGFNTAVSQVTVICPAETTVFASYSYDWEPEQWAEMIKGTSQNNRDNALKSTEFRYSLPYAEDVKAVASLRIVLERPTGRVDDAFLLNATGKQQMIVLPHYAKAETIELRASTGNVIFSYEESSKIITLIATKKADIYATYDWIAETPICNGFVSCFNE